MTSKKDLSERDICTKFIQPALEKAGWDNHTQIREEVSFTDGRIYVKGNLTTRGKRKRADYILYHKPNIPIAVIEAKDNTHTVKAGIQQALGYAEILDIPCAYSSNGDGFHEHDRTCSVGKIETELTLEQFPTPDTLWQRYKKYKGIETKEQERIAAQDYFFDGTGRTPRYYQQIAINRSVEAIAGGQKRILITMATGTGKTDKHGLLVGDRIYNRKDFDKNLVMDERTETVARKVTEFLKKTGRFDKTIIFCVDIEHAQRRIPGTAYLFPSLQVRSTEQIQIENRSTYPGFCAMWDQN